VKLNKIVIVGGGSAGWMTASTLIKAFPNKDITLIESPNVPVIGVGESTIQRIRNWTTYLGIDDKQFLKHTDGIYKLSIKFTDFYKKGTEFHYPFGVARTDNTRAEFNDWWFKKEFYPETSNTDYADCYSPAMALVNQNKIDYEFEGFRLDTDSAYHFDAIKFGHWLKEHYCLPRGVKHIQEDITDIQQDENGIKSLNGKHEADLYIDCTGFKALLLDKTLNEPFESLEDKLPNNSAWATRMPYRDKEKELKPYTNCTAIENGWVWNIPLWNRIGTGYVYSDKFVDDETALQQFKNHLGLNYHDHPNHDDLEFRKIKMRTGIHKRLFVKNVAAVGLAGGFIEPLESNGLFSVHEFLIELVRNLRRDYITQWDKDNYTHTCKSMFYKFAEFVGMHYALSIRNDTDYWRANNQKQWEESLITSKPKMQIGYLYSAIDRNQEHRFANDGGGLHFIAAGMNWAPTDKDNLMYHNLMSEEKLKKLYQPAIAYLDVRKGRWNSKAKNSPDNIQFLKDNIYT